MGDGTGRMDHNAVKYLLVKKEKEEEAGILGVRRGSSGHEEGESKWTVTRTAPVTLTHLSLLFTLILPPITFPRPLHYQSGVGLPIYLERRTCGGQ